MARRRGGEESWQDRAIAVVERLERLTAVSAVDRLQLAVRPEQEEDAIALVAEAVRLALVALSASMGECRQTTPYSPMRPVLGVDGKLEWCCNHETEHCG